MGFVCPDCLAEIGDAGVENCLSCGTVRPPSGWPPDPLTGLIIGGRYRLESRLGSGGMAAVFRASRVGALGGTVAVKLLAPRLARTVIAKRFEREAQVVSRLTNPYIVRIYDFDTFKLPGRDDNLYYFAMELVEGATLTSVLRKQGKVNFLWGIDVLRQLARGLDEAHSQGITHRDLKPSNIMLQQQRSATHVKILDFGIAALSEQDGLPANANQEKLTQTGFISGTPDYMAPEQAVGDANIGAPADIYALGLVAYEMFSGQRAFSGGNTMEILLARVTRPPPKLADVCPPETPPDLFRIVDKMLEKNPKDRYQSAGELLDELAIFPTLQTSPDFVPPAELLQLYPSTRSSVAAVPASAGASPALGKEQSASTRIAPSSIRPATASKKGVPAWVWIVVVVLLGGIGAAVALVLTQGGSTLPTKEPTSIAGDQPDATTPPATTAPTTVAATVPATTASTKVAEPDVVAAPEVVQPLALALSGPRPALEAGFTEVSLGVGEYMLKLAVPTNAPALYQALPMRVTLDRGASALRIAKGTATLTLARDGQAVGRVEGAGRDADGRLALDLPARPIADGYLMVLSLFLPDGTEIPVRVALDGANGRLSAP